MRRKKLHMPTGLLLDAGTIPASPLDRTKTNEGKNTLVDTLVDIVVEIFSQNASPSEEDHRKIFRAVLGKRIRNARESVGMTVTELAALVGVSKQMISLLEHGQTGVRKEKREKIYEALRSRGAAI